MTDPAKQTPEQSRKFGRMIIMFGALEAAFILGLSFLTRAPWMPFIALLSVPTFIWGFWVLRKANDAEAPR